MHLPSPQQSARHETRGENTSNSAGTSVTASGSTNTKGSWSNLGSTTSFAYEGFTLYQSRPSNAASILTDIGIDDGAGNINILLPDFAFAGQKLVNEHNTHMYIPVHVPAGSQLVARCQASVASTIAYTKITGHSKNPGGFPGFSRAIKLFTGGSGSRGDAVDPGGSAHTKGSWTQLVASTSDDIKALCFVVGYNNDLNRAATGVACIDIGIGGAGSEQVILTNFQVGWGVTYDCPIDQFFQPMSCNIPAGTRVAARCQSNITTAGDRTVDISAWGFV